MKLACLVAIIGVAVLSTGCAATSQTAEPQSAKQQEEPVVVVRTQEDAMLPGSSEWEWTPTDQPMRLSSDGAIPATSLSAEKSTRGRHLDKKRLPSPDNR